MPGEYPTEQTPFTPLGPTDPFHLLRGPGAAALEQGKEVFRTIGKNLADAADGLRGAGSQLAGAHEGAAAEASRRCLTLLEDLTRAGADETGRAVTAIEDQRSYFEHAHRTVGGIALPGEPTGLSGDLSVEQAVHSVQLDESTHRAVEAAEVFRISANDNFGTRFQPFEAPPALPVDAGPGLAPAGGPGIGGAGGPVVPAPSGAGPVGPPGAASPQAAGTPAPGGGTAGNPTPIPPLVPGHRPGIPPVVRPSIPPPAQPGVRPAVRPGTPPGTVPSPRSSTPPPRPAIPLRPAVPPLPTAPSPGAPRSGWQPGQPWTNRAVGGTPGYRPSPGELGATPGPRAGAPTEPPARPGPGPAGTGPSHASSTATRGAGLGHVPLMPPGHGGAAEDTTHRRPPWLLQDDPESIWFAGLPSYTDPVIGAEPDPR